MPRAGEPIEPLLPFNEVCDLLGVSAPTVYRLMARDEIARVKVCGRTMFEPQAVRGYIEKQRRGRLANEDGPLDTGRPQSSGMAPRHGQE